MEIKIVEKHCIITPLSPCLNEWELSRLIPELKKHSQFKIGLDLSFVQDCTFNFIEFLLNFKELNLFNIPSNIFVILNCMKLNNLLNLFVSEQDFLTSSHRLVMRDFYLVER